MGTGTTNEQRTNQANEGEKNESLRGWITLILGVLLVCSTAALFTAGHGYRLGYMYEIGFDLAQLQENFHETAFWGFSGGMPLAFAWFVATVVVMAACGLLIWAAEALWKQATSRWRALRRMSLPSPHQGRKVDTHVKLILGAVLLLPVIYLLAMAYLGMAEFQKAGTKRGKELIEAFQADATTASKKYRIQTIELRFRSPSEPVVRGYRLLCTQSLCSIYDPDPKVRGIRLVSLENLIEIRVVHSGPRIP